MRPNLGESPGGWVRAALPPLPSPSPALSQLPLTAFPQRTCLFGVDLCCGRKAIKMLLLVQKERGLLYAHGHFRKAG